MEKELISIPILPDIIGNRRLVSYFVDSISNKIKSLSFKIVHMWNCSNIWHRYYSQKRVEYGP